LKQSIFHTRVWKLDNSWNELYTSLNETLFHATCHKQLTSTSRNDNLSLRFHFVFISFEDQEKISINMNSSYCVNTRNSTPVFDAVLGFVFLNTPVNSNDSGGIQKLDPLRLKAPMISDTRSLEPLNLRWLRLMNV